MAVWNKLPSVSGVFSAMLFLVILAVIVSFVGRALAGGFLGLTAGMLSMFAIILLSVGPEESRNYWFHNVMLINPRKKFLAWLGYLFMLLSNSLIVGGFFLFIISDGPVSEPSDDNIAAAIVFALGFIIATVGSIIGAVLWSKSDKDYLYDGEDFSGSFSHRPLVAAVAIWPVCFALSFLSYVYSISFLLLALPFLSYTQPNPEIARRYRVLRVIAYTLLIGVGFYTYFIR